MKYKNLVADLFGLVDASTKTILAAALNTPVLGEAIAIAKTNGFDARKKADWEKLYHTIINLIKEREEFEQQAAIQAAKDEKEIAFEYKGSTYRVASKDDLNKFNVLRSIAGRSGMYRVKVRGLTLVIDRTYYENVGLYDCISYVYDISPNQRAMLFANNRVADTGDDRFLYASATWLDDLVRASRQVDIRLFDRTIQSARAKAQLESLYLTSV